MQELYLDAYAFALANLYLNDHQYSQGIVVDEFHAMIERDKAQVEALARESLVKDAASMTPDKELSELMQSIASKSLQIIAEVKRKPPQMSHLLRQFKTLTEHFNHYVTTILSNPQAVWENQTSYWQEALDLTQSQLQSWLEGKPMPITDRRFNGEEWQSHPFYNFLSQHYLLASQCMERLLNSVNYTDKNSAKQLQFFTRQYIDALSPTNFFHTNPQIMAETLTTQGKNLLYGLNNLLSDIAANPSNPSIQMSDSKAFIVGKTIAATPGKVIFRNQMMELIQYTAKTEQVRAIPLLIIPPWINKYYVLDLSPHNSLVHWLVTQGITVFMISWVNPDATFAGKSIYDYLQEGPRTAIQVIQRQLTIAQVNVLGFCIGGTLLAILLAYNQAHKDNSIACATFLATMIDFSDPGDIAVFINEQHLQNVEKEMKAKGYLPGEFMASSFNALRANDLIWSFFVKNYLQGKTSVPFDILYWNSDSTNMPATMHSQYLRWMYLQNKLIKPGKIRLKGTALDVTSIKIPTFFLSTEKDHIAPWKTTYLGFAAMKGPKCFVLAGSGHIAGIINAPEQKKYSYKINPNSNLNAEQWLAKAKEYPGSWWPEWHQWLANHSGAYISAPLFSHLTYQPLMKAPGSYVLKK